MHLNHTPNTYDPQCTADQRIIMQMFRLLASMESSRGDPRPRLQDRTGPLPCHTRYYPQQHVNPTGPDQFIIPMSVFAASNSHRVIILKIETRWINVSPKIHLTLN